MSRVRVGAAVVAISLGAVFSSAVHAYVTSASWKTTKALYYINPANRDVSANSAESAVEVGAATWTTQSGASFEFVYGGRVTDTKTAYDGRNVVIFRNATNSTNSGALATTYSWTSNGKLLDADIVFWDGAFTFYTGTTGCYKGAYIEDIATHEFGHALGLKHSSVSGATMKPTYSYCSKALRSLALDDISGVDALYPPTGSGAPGGDE